MCVHLSIDNRERDTIENTSYRHTRVYVLLSRHNVSFLIWHDINKHVADYRYTIDIQQLFYKINSCLIGNNRRRIDTGQNLSH